MEDGTNWENEVGGYGCLCRVLKIEILVAESTMDEGLLSLRWNDHGLAFFNMLSNIRKDESFCDVTLTCDGYFYPVHKFVLSTCSDFFYQIFEKTPCKHPVIIIANVSRKDLEALLNYMYLGEVSVFRTELKSLVKAAEILKIKGLAEQTENSSVNENKEKRSSSWEADQPESKRTKSEDYSSVYTKQKETERSAHVKDSTTKTRILDTEALNDQDAKGSEVIIDDSLDSLGELTSAEISDSRRNESSSESNQDLPEVKVEEVFVKEEFSDSWYDEAEAGVGGYQYDSPVPGLNYGPPQAALQDNSASWDLASAQVQAREGRLAARATGPSRLQGASDRRKENHTEEQRERYRKYDATRRSRNFVDHWRSEFGWVYYDTNLRVMTCTTCLKYGTKDDKKTRFVSGNSNFKRLALVRHEVSQTHRRCEARRTAESADAATPTQSR
ncbi:longitudinals lacking protein, isoforms H/M/V-like isoform X4 [Penaeus chinensis]|uniref:longitudinals lacking protein, isoforms H/M/V-like isoform X4 n=1 Tax=Penaeus chinensis TaxID=139456 RepID=UPI001FB5A344|nr:longitudinals lacking protein, isoforms H/M/V-like isoform X4 [Penaeus chinensis]